MIKHCKLINNFLFVFVIVAMVIFKWNDLELPYFWDELGVYAQAVDYQYLHHLSLAPAAVPPVISRGHPLLFTFINACTMRVFGEHIVVAHLCCFFISVLLLCSIYIKVSRYFNAETGMLSVIFFAVQPLFLAQSGLLLPEMSLTLFSFWAICCYYEKRFILFSIFASMAILTKEAAIVLPFTMLCYSFFSWVLTRNKPGGLKIINLLFTMVPYLIFALFLWVQKQQNGWYFFPLHIESVSFNVFTFFRQLSAYKTFIFLSQGRVWLTYMLIIGAALAFMTGKWTFNRMGNSFVLLLGLAALAFSGMGGLVDLYVDRYLTAQVLVFSIFAAIAVCNISLNRIWLLMAIGLSLLGSIPNLENGHFNYDADLGYKRQVHVMKQAFTFLDKTMGPDDKAFANFPGYFALSFPKGGYWEGRQKEVLDIPANGSYYLVMCNPGAWYPTDSIATRMMLLRKYTDGYANAEVYRVKSVAP